MTDNLHTQLCCFRWEITQGPHAGAHFTHCVQGKHVVADSTSPVSPVVLVIGRQKHCWMRLRKDLEVSSVHAQIRYVEDTQQPMLRDVKSTNGTKLNGELLVVEKDYPIAHQDLIEVGRTVIRVLLGNNNSSIGCSDANGTGISESQSMLVIKDSVSIDLTNTDTEEGVEQIAVPTTTQTTEIVASDQPKIQSETELDKTQTQTEVVHKQHRREKDDSDDFEAPAAKPKLSTVTCMICNQCLNHLDVLEQQMHINACLDGKSWTSFQSKSVPLSFALQPSSAISFRNGTENTKKRKRQQNQDEAEQLALAKALSKSIVDKEQETDMELALLAGELAQIDKQMARLAKKRAVLEKNIQKLEKHKAKVRKSQVLPPAEVKQRLAWTLVSKILFPTEWRVPIDEKKDNEIQNQPFQLACTKEMEVTKKYIPRRHTNKSANGADAVTVSMWARASQQFFGYNERQLYRNCILGQFMTDENTEDTSLVYQKDVETSVVKVEMFSSVPDAVKRVFPQWEENLEFLQAQKLEELEDALEELIRTKPQDVLLEPENENDVENSSSRAQRRDELEAWAYFEHVMRQLITTKSHQPALVANLRISDQVTINDVDEDEDVDRATTMVNVSSDAQEKQMIDSDSSNINTKEEEEALATE